MPRMIRLKHMYMDAANRVGPRRINTFWKTYGMMRPVLLCAEARAQYPANSTASICQCHARKIAVNRNSLQKPPIVNGRQNHVLVLYMRQDINAVMPRNSSRNMTAAAIDGT